VNAAIQFLLVNIAVSECPPSDDDDPHRHHAGRYAANAATLPGSVDIEPQRAPNGDYFAWLDPAVANRLGAMRGPGESYSDVILRLAKRD
jgi:hypothetical protein